MSGRFPTNFSLILNSHCRCNELVSRKSVLERVYRHCRWRSPSRRGFPLVDERQLRRCDGEISRIRSRTDSIGKRQPVSRSEEHTSELQSLRHLVCRLLLEKKKKKKKNRKKKKQD